MESNVTEVISGEISIRAQTSTFFEWEIHDFFRLPKELDLCVKSPMFWFMDAEWRLEIYPNGKKDSSEWISLYIMRVRSFAKSHFVGFRLGIRRKDGSENDAIICEDIFAENVMRQGGIALRKSFLTSFQSAAVPPNTVTIFCFLHSYACDASQVEGINKLAKDFENLLTNEINSDVTLQLKDKEFKAHKSILRARSSVFDSMFTHNMVEKIPGTVDIPDCDPEAFRYFLTFLYSASTDNLSKDIVFNLYFIAEKYCVEELKRKCVEFMVRNLSVDIFFNVVALSWQYQHASLLELATDFFIQNTKEVITSAQWQSFLKEYPVAANEFYIKSFDRNISRKRKNMSSDEE